jgi:hypothetical protein
LSFLFFLSLTSRVLPVFYPLNLKMATTVAQVNTARSLITFGAFSQFIGMVLGMFVPAMRFPRLGLGAHINIMSSGIISLTTGVILYQPNLVQMSSGFLRLVMWGIFSSAVVMGSETLNGWWGTNQFLTIVSLQISFWRQERIGGSTRLMMDRQQNKPVQQEGRHFKSRLCFGRTLSRHYCLSRPLELWFGI